MLDWGVWSLGAISGIALLMALARPVASNETRDNSKREHHLVQAQPGSVAARKGGKQHHWLSFIGRVS